MKCQHDCPNYEFEGYVRCLNCGKRLGPSVSGAEPGYAGRVAVAESGAAEARSEEGLRVTPVEAKEALLKLRDDMAREAKISRKIAKVERHPETQMSRYRHYEGIASGLMSYVVQLECVIALLEPESEAATEQSAPHENPAPKMPADAEPPRDERSGRRNA